MLWCFFGVFLIIIPRSSNAARGQAEIKAQHVLDESVTFTSESIVPCLQWVNERCWVKRAHAKRSLLVDWLCICAANDHRDQLKASGSVAVIRRVNKNFFWHYCLIKSSKCNEKSDGSRYHWKKYDFCIICCCDILNSLTSLCLCSNQIDYLIIF